MLKLERKSHDRGVNLVLREKGLFLNREFLKALALAVSLHLFGLLLFSIQPFKIRKTPSPFPPIQVNVEIAPLNQTIFASLEEELPFLSRIPEPVWRSPEKIGSFLTLIDRRPPPAFPRFFPDDPFAPMTDRLRLTQAIQMDPSALTPQQSVEIRITGPLADRPLLNNGISPFLAAQKGPKHLLRYKIKVDDSTGKVFWSSLARPIDKKKLKDYADSILAQMEFVPFPAGFVTEGALEIFLPFPGVARDD